MTRCGSLLTSSDLRNSQAPMNPANKKNSHLRSGFGRKNVKLGRGGAGCRRFGRLTFFVIGGHASFVLFVVRRFRTHIAVVITPGATVVDEFRLTGHPFFVQFKEPKAKNWIKTFQENPSVCICTFDELGFVMDQCSMNHKFHLIFEESGKIIPLPEKKHLLASRFAARAIDANAVRTAQLARLFFQFAGDGRASDVVADDIVRVGTIALRTAGGTDKIDVFDGHSHLGIPALTTHLAFGSHLILKQGSRKNTKKFEKSVSHSTTPKLTRLTISSRYHRVQVRRARRAFAARNLIEISARRYVLIQIQGRSADRIIKIVDARSDQRIISVRNVRRTLFRANDVEMCYETGLIIRRTG
uniref:Uncharacterized protein n=1 Tax=Romanomermis culicivorax TaxID=13658 RepID=A0A915HMY5_ROMCU